MPTLHIFLFSVLLTSSSQTSSISVYKVFEDFVVVAKLSTSTQRNSKILYRKLARTKERFNRQVTLQLGEGRKASHSFAPRPRTSAAVNAHLGTLNHDEKEEGTSATGCKFSNTHLIYKKTPDLHVKS